MRYVAHVVAVYPANQANSTFDVWENIVVIEAEGPHEAIERAVALSQAALSGEDNWHMLGYSTKPVLYGVRSISSYVEFSHSARESGTTDCQILTKCISITKEELQKLKSFDEIPNAYRLIHLVPS